MLQQFSWVDAGFVFQVLNPNNPCHAVCVNQQFPSVPKYSFRFLQDTIISQRDNAIITAVTLEMLHCHWDPVVFRDGTL